MSVAAQPAGTSPLEAGAGGVVPQTNTLDRSLDVSENLYFHGLYFGMNSREAHPPVATGVSRSSHRRQGDAGSPRVRNRRQLVVPHTTG